MVHDYNNSCNHADLQPVLYITDWINLLTNLTTLSNMLPCNYQMYWTVINKQYLPTGPWNTTNLDWALYPVWQHHVPVSRPRLSVFSAEIAVVPTPASLWSTPQAFAVTMTEEKFIRLHFTNSSCQLVLVSVTQNWWCRALHGPGLGLKFTNSNGPGRVRAEMSSDRAGPESVGPSRPVVVLTFSCVKL